LISDISVNGYSKTNIWKKTDDILVEGKQLDEKEDSSVTNMFLKKIIDKNCTVTSPDIINAILILLLLFLK